MLVMIAALVGPGIYFILRARRGKMPDIRRIAGIDAIGEAIGRGMTCKQALAATESVIEGVATTASVVELAEKHGVEMPITQAVHEVLFEGKAPAAAIAELMSRPLKAES